MGSRVRSLAEPEPVDAVAMMIEGHLWCWIDADAIFIRLRPGDVPDDFHVPAQQSDLDFIRAVRGDKVRGPALPVERDDTTTIAGIPVDEDKLDAVERLHPTVAWQVWRGWFVGRDEAGELVAVWKMPATHGLLNVNLTEHDGDLWAFNAHLLFRMDTAAIRPEALAKMRKHLSPDPGIAGRIEKASRGAKVVPVQRSGEHGAIVRIGGCVVPREQYLAVLGNCGKDVAWLWSSPTSPVLASKGGKIVAIIMPIIVETTAARGQA